MNWIILLDMFASGCLFIHAVCVINRMTRRTNHLIRASYIVLGVGSIAVVFAPVYGYLHPHVGEVLINCGAAMALIIGRWLRHGGRKHEGYSSLNGPLFHRDGTKL